MGDKAGEHHSELENDAMAVSVATSGQNTPNAVRVERPSTKAEWTFIGAGAAAVWLSIMVIMVLTWGPAIDHERTQFIGIMGIIAIIGVPLMIVALISPTVGHVSAHAGPGGVALDVDGAVATGRIKDPAKDGA